MNCLLSGYSLSFLQIGVLIITVLRLVCAVIYIFLGSNTHTQRMVNENSSCLIFQRYHIHQCMKPTDK